MLPFLLGFLLLTVPAPVEWLSLPEAISIAAEEDRPILVYAKAPWCGPCKKMEREVFPNISPLLNRFVLAKLDFDDHELQVSVAGKQLSPFEWARHLGIDVTPGFALMKPDGKIITQFTGFRDQREMSLALAFVVTGAYRHGTFESYLIQAGH